MLAEYDGKRCAVLIDIGTHRRLVKGMACYRIDLRLGPILAIEIEESAKSRSGDVTLNIQEDQWNGDILGGDLFDCDCCIGITPDIGMRC
jgi:hypothetical protein